MAYTRDIAQKCRVCGGKATVEVMNNRNASMGYFCKLDGQAEIERLNRLEMERGERARREED